LSDKIELLRRVTLDFTDSYDDKNRDLAYAWLEKWEEEYRILKDHFYQIEEQHFDIGFPVRFDLLCSEKAFIALPPDAHDSSSEWVKQGIIIDSRKNRKEEFEFERSAEPVTMGEELKKPLKLKKTEAAE
jgi:hypothetical protein